VLVQLTLVILKLVATHPLFLAMIMMHVLMTNATLTLDVPTPQLIVTITMNVPMILANQVLDVPTNATNANTKMLAIL
jgi:hypothetical protein